MVDPIHNIGGVNLPFGVMTEIGDLVARLAETYSFKNGQLAFYFNLLSVAAQHVDKGLE